MIAPTLAVLAVNVALWLPVLFLALVALVAFACSALVRQRIFDRGYWRGWADRNDNVGER
jgi:uncharacterized membrane protein